MRAGPKAPQLSAKRWLLSRTGRSSVKPLTISTSSRAARWAVSGGARLSAVAGLRAATGRNEREEHAAADADLAVVERDTAEASGMASAFSSAMRRCSSIWRFFTSASGCWSAPSARQHADQDEHEGASNPAIRSPKTAPDRRRLLDAVVAGVEASCIRPPGGRCRLAEALLQFVNDALLRDAEIDQLARLRHGVGQLVVAAQQRLVELRLRCRSGWRSARRSIRQKRCTAKPKASTRLATSTALPVTCAPPRWRADSAPTCAVNCAPTRSSMAAEAPTIASMAVRCSCADWADAIEQRVEAAMRRPRSSSNALFSPCLVGKLLAQLADDFGGHARRFGSGLHQAGDFVDGAGGVGLCIAGDVIRRSRQRPAISCCCASVWAPACCHSCCSVVAIAVTDASSLPSRCSSRAARSAYSTACASPTPASNMAAFCAKVCVKPFKNAARPVFIVSLLRSCVASAVAQVSAAALAVLSKRLAMPSVACPPCRHLRMQRGGFSGDAGHRSLDCHRGVAPARARTFAQAVPSASGRPTQPCAL